MLLILAAALAPWIAPQNPYDLLQIDVLDARLTPGSMNGLDTFHYWLGTDGQAATCCRHSLRPAHQPGGGRGLGADRRRGRHAAGLLAAYAGGKTDALIMRLVDLILSFRPSWWP